MKLRRLLPPLLSSIILFSAVSVHSQTAHETREKLLDKEILSIYKDLVRARELLSYQTLDTLPANTTIQFIGNYPNRTGLRIRKFNIETEPNSKSKLKRSEEKSLLLEFNGSVLSKVEVSVIEEDVQIEQKSKTIILDNTPLDEVLNDMEILFSGIEGSSKINLSDLKNEDIKPERNNFKKDFYIKFLLDFHSQISSILALQKNQGIKGQKNMMKQLNQSLRY
ncbi:LIC_12096 family protein [Leptospira idonii]|uniref:LIC_12096 family protein n=1 Tax=Leptospira idonii TaxID=1193500 RepID=UPI0014384097|nr:hypothetical protein [Leptospira idonii]